MAIQVQCSCGKTMLVKDEWEGRLVKCPQCGVALEIPSSECAPQPGTVEMDDGSQRGEFSSPLRMPATPAASPFAQKSPPAKSKGGWFRWLFWEFPRFGSKFKWNEPFSFRVRLRGDILRRLVVVLAVWAAGTGGFLVLFAINRDPPGIPLAIGLATIFGGIAALFMFGRREHVSGRINIGKEGIRYDRTYASLTLPGTWHEWSHWPYEIIDSCVIVPAELLEKSFSAMSVLVASKQVLIGIPNKIDLDELKRHLEGMGVLVQFGESVSDGYREPLDLGFPIVVGAMSSVCFLAGMGFYAISMGGLRPPQARVEKAHQAQINQMQEMAEKARLDAEQFRSGLSRLDLENKLPPFPNAPGPPGPSPAAGDADDRSAVIGSKTPRSRGFGGRFRPGMGELESRGPGPNMMPPGIPRFGRFGAEVDHTNTDAVGPPQPTRPTLRSPGPVMPEGHELPGNTELVGGAGGVPFRSTHRDGLPVIGFRYALGSWNGTAALQKLEPIYDQSPASGTGATLVAREGYAVGAVLVDAQEFVTAVQVTFMRLRANGRLDPHDSYTSDWLGEPSGASPKKIGGTGVRVLGVHGQAAAVLDAVGLVMETR